jgi:hypothetical protein
VQCRRGEKRAWLSPARWAALEWLPATAAALAAEFRLLAPQLSAAARDCAALPPQLWRLSSACSHPSSPQRLATAQRCRRSAGSASCTRVHAATHAILDPATYASRAHARAHERRRTLGCVSIKTPPCVTTRRARYATCAGTASASAPAREGAAATRSGAAVRWSAFTIWPLRSKTTCQMCERCDGVVLAGVVIEDVDQCALWGRMNRGEGKPCGVGRSEECVRRGGLAELPSESTGPQRRFGLNSGGEKAGASRRRRNALRGCVKPCARAQLG